MGWLWSDTAQPAKEPLEPTKPNSTSASKQPPTPSPPTSTPKPLNRDEIAAAEFQSLLKELESPTNSPNTTSTEDTSTYHPARTNSESKTPSQLYPTELSCRAAFDAAYHCQLPGGQFLNVYRYGTMRNCSELWSNFWFCMRTNRGFMTEEERVERIQQFYRQREERLRSGPSSEDIWEARKENELLKGEGGKPLFSMDFAAWERGEE
jgi:hypothetical protein